MADIPLQQVLSAPVVIWASLEQLQANVSLAHLNNTKTPVANNNALSVLPAELQMKCKLRVKTHLGALAKLAKNTCMTWDFEKNGHAKRALRVQCASQMPVGPPCKPGKAIGSYLGTRNKLHPLPNARFPLALLQTMGPIVPPVPSVSSVAFATPISIALQRALATLVRPLPPRHERGPWSL